LLDSGKRISHIAIKNSTTCTAEVASLAILKKKTLKLVATYGLALGAVFLELWNKLSS
jgi:hypothetical protein